MTVRRPVMRYHGGKWRRVETKAFADRGEERTEVLWINDAAVEAGRLPFGKPMPLWDTAP